MAKPWLKKNDEVQVTFTANELDILRQMVMFCQVGQMGYDYEETLNLMVKVNNIRNDFQINYYADA